MKVSIKDSQKKKKRFRRRHCVIFPRRRQTKPACHPSRLAPAAALIRGNRNNCTQFSNNLDWLVSKLERLESSSGTPAAALKHLFRRATALKDKSHRWLAASENIYTQVPHHPRPNPRHHPSLPSPEDPNRPRASLTIVLWRACAAFRAC